MQRIAGRRSALLRWLPALRARAGVNERPAGDRLDTGADASMQECVLRTGERAWSLDRPAPREDGNEYPTSVSAFGNGPKLATLDEADDVVGRNSVFDDITWQEDQFSLADAVFWMDPAGTVPRESLATDRFTLYKSRLFIGMYQRFFASVDLLPKTIFELGLWDGGSLAFWASLFDPQKIVGIDRNPRGDSPYFTEWVASRGIGDRVSTYWGVDQSAKETLREIVDKEFDGPLDLVIDDCSHILEPTVASFEALFPLMRTGGWYIIEDWTWEYNSVHGIGGMAGQHGLVDFICELTRAGASKERGLVRSIVLNGGFVAIERGPATLVDPAEFRLSDFIGKGPAPQARTSAFKRVIEAPPSDVFQAWTDPEIMTKWWRIVGGPEPEIRVDLRPGGRYSIILRNDTEHRWISGEFQAIEFPSSLDQTYKFTVSGDDVIGANLSVTFRPHGDGTEVGLRFADMAVEGNAIPKWWRISWEERLDRFAQACTDR